MSTDWRSTLLAFDASSIIYAWDNYPPEQFPPLWQWLGDEVQRREIRISEVAFEEVKRHEPECADWLSANMVEKVGISNAVVSEAIRIKRLLGISEDQYHAKGVGENDLLIIACARVNGDRLISNEGRQNQIPKVRARMKIPAVCDLEEVAVPCLDFLDLIRESGKVFGNS